MSPAGVSRKQIDRRCLLQAGALGGLGLSLAELYAAEAAPSKIRACILVFYYGGPSQLDTWDMKPDAPAEIRGEYRAIETSAPGVRVCEHLPRTARVMHRLAVIRSMHHGMTNHNAAAVEALCGRTPLGGDQELLADDSLSFPCYGAALTYAAAREKSDLPAVALPHVMRNVVRLPGQTAGFLGSPFQPYQVESDPSSPSFTPGELRLPAGLTPERLSSRESLLRLVDRQLDRTEGLLGARSAPAPYERAFSLLRSERVRRAFDISRETAPVRDRYGRSRLGQSMLLARRLVEAGVSFVTVYDGMHNGQDANWDSHEKLFPRHKELLPPADQAFSALIEDLETRGLLDSTLVLAMGEFGRTSKVNQSAGRDHWPYCYSVVLGGGGVRGGTLYGTSDAAGMYPAADPVTPGDLAATLFWRFGIDPRAEIRDTLARPYPIAAGEPLRQLF